MACRWLERVLRAGDALSVALRACLLLGLARVQETSASEVALVGDIGIEPLLQIHAAYLSLP
jgi:hypothetical protein